MGFYNQSVNITTDLWKDILQDKEICTDQVLQILTFLYQSEGYGSSAGKIALALNYIHHAPLNRIIPDFSKRILKKYPFINPPIRENGSIRFWHMPFVGTDDKRNFIWILRPELAEALSYTVPDIKPHQSILFQEIEQFKKSSTSLEETTRETIIQSRIGQGQFRLSVIAYWQGCSVTGCSQIEILRASHIKPWRDCTNDERLNVYNGLLLLPNLDACFDIGFISFSDEGNILVSSQISDTTLAQLSINREMKLLKIEPEHKIFLEYHRQRVFHA
ncbi:MAG: HNH endonuclease [Chloroflexota bacterium]